MEKSSILLWIVAGLLILNLLYSFFGTGSQIKLALDKLNDAQKSLTAARDSIQSSKAKIDSVKSDILRFRSYVKDIQGRVEYLDLNIRYKKEVNADSVKKINSRIVKIKEEIGLTGEDLPVMPPTPEDLGTHQ